MIGTSMIEKLSSKYDLNKVTIGSDSKLRKGLLHFTIDRYDVKGVGNLCILSMQGYWGLVKMETVIFASETKDIPLLNTDNISFGKKTVQLVELYDTRIISGDGSLESKCQAVKDADADIEDYFATTGKYSADLLSCSYGKSTKTDAERIVESAKKYVDIFVEELEGAPYRDTKAGKEKNVEFAESLLKNGGPAVNKIKKMFGEKTAERIIRNHMYGADR